MLGKITPDIESRAVAIRQSCERSVAAAIIDSLADCPEHVLFDGADEAMTAGEFLSSAARRQASLLSAGIKRGDVLLVTSGRSDNGFWIDLLSVWAAGATIVPLDPATPPDQLRHIIDLVEPKGHLHGQNMEFEGFDGIRSFPLCNRAAEPGRRPTVAEDTDPGETAGILFTSGSTGVPKGVVLSHRSILGNASALLDRVSVVEEDRLFIAIPFHFTSAVCHFLATALTPATLIATEQRLFKADLANLLGATRATCFGGAPLQLRWIAECAAVEPMKLRWVMSSGDHLSTDTISRFRSVLPDTSIYTVYGLTEVGGRLCVLPPEMVSRVPGSVGQPIPGMKLRVLDEGGRRCPPNVVGDVYVTGDWLFDGYYRDEGATKKNLGPWGLRTGDLGLIDDNGFLYLRGRSDDVFKSSGKKVSGLMISDALMRTEFFEDVFVMAQPHAVVGHVPYVYFVPRKNVQFDRGATVRHLRKTLPADHIPQAFIEVPAIPRTGSGKVIRREMRDLARQHGPASDG